MRPHSLADGFIIVIAAGIAALALAGCAKPARLVLFAQARGKRYRVEITGEGTVVERTPIRISSPTKRRKRRGKE